jgi:hypothetical protein
MSALVSVPKTTIDEDRFSKSSEDKIGFSGKCSDMQPEHSTAKMPKMQTLSMLRCVSKDGTNSLGITSSRNA